MPPRTSSSSAYCTQPSVGAAGYLESPRHIPFFSRNANVTFPLTRNKANPWIPTCLGPAPSYLSMFSQNHSDLNTSALHATGPRRALLSKYNEESLSGRSHCATSPSRRTAHVHTTPGLNAAWRVKQNRKQLPIDYRCIRIDLALQNLLACSHHRTPLSPHVRHQLIPRLQQVLPSILVLDTETLPRLVSVLVPVT